MPEGFATVIRVSEKVVRCPFCRRFVNEKIHDFSKCFEKFWTSRVACPSCSSTHTRKDGLAKGYIQRYECLDCGCCWQEYPSPEDNRKLDSGNYRNLIKENFGTCIKCKKPNEELADGLCVDCFDTLSESSLHRYKKKFVLEENYLK